MNGQNPSPIEASQQRTLGSSPAQVGWGYWALSVMALAAAGALSYLAGAAAPLAVFTLPPVAMLVFGFLAGGVHGLALRRKLPPARQWILASMLAGCLAACASAVSTFPPETSEGLLAGWAYAWATYGAVYGLMLQRITAHRRLALVSLAGWATAGIVSGAVAWALGVFQVTETIPRTAFIDLPSRSWSLAGLALAGAVCGAVGQAIVGSALVLLSRAIVPPHDGEERSAEDTKRVRVAGIICGLVAAVLCTYLAPLVLTLLQEGSLESLDLTIFFLSAIYGSPVCVPTIALVAVPLSIGCGYVGLEIGRASGRPGSGFLVWCGAAIGGGGGYLLGSLVAFAFGHMKG